MSCHTISEVVDGVALGDWVWLGVAEGVDETVAETVADGDSVWLGVDETVADGDRV